MAVLTRGWFRGSTFGPCKEWQHTISTSSGRYFSKAAISGALQEVCPPTMAPCLVASRRLAAKKQAWRCFRTRSVLCDNFVYRSRLNVVNNVIACSGHEMSIWKYLHSFLWTPQHNVRTIYIQRCLLCLQIPHVKLRTCLPYHMHSPWGRWISLHYEDWVTWETSVSLSSSKYMRRSW